MLTVIGLMIKSFFSKAIDVFMRYPLQIILVLVCMYVFWQKTRYDAIVSEYEAFKAEIVQAEKMQQIKNEILRKQAQKSLDDATSIYEANIKAIKNEYLKKQKLDSITINDLRDKLRQQIASDTFTMPETFTDTSRTAEEWRNRHSAVVEKYETLASACAITTNDYNFLRDWADAACNQVGCE